jgi:hypothetical protein
MRLSAHWARIGLMEHASVAAFARFTLHLLAVGAPPDLVMASQRAMGDETEHARLAFALASAYAGRDIGPGPLPIDGSLEDFDVGSMLATLVREGCIGETLAAVEAVDALECAEDSAIRTVLERIAADETRHAELAWRALAWLIDAGRVQRAHVRRIVDEALEEAAQEGPRPGDDDLRVFGIVGGSRRRDIRRQALSRVVRSCADAMIRTTPRTSRASAAIAGLRIQTGGTPG